MAEHDERVALTGNEAGALAMKQIAPDVVAAYPITPQTELMQGFAQYVADRDVDTEMILVESEHSAMSAVIGASASGVRAMTATSANGLALMWELLFIAAGYRLPIVMELVSRSLGGPINIHCDHSDAMGARETGWIQLFSENAQEVYDNTLMAIRIAESEDVLAPVMIVQDGFITSHTTQVLSILPDEAAKGFVGSYRPGGSLSDFDHRPTYGAIVLPDFYMQIKRQQAAALAVAPSAMAQVADDYADLTGRRYQPIELYRMEDAELALVLLGSAAGTAAAAIDELREDGVRVGMVKIRQFRPFPSAEVAEALSRSKAVAALERTLAFGSTLGPIGADVASSLISSSRIPPLANYVYGLGGRDLTVEDLEEVCSQLAEVATTGKVKEPVRYVGVD